MNKYYYDLHIHTSLSPCADILMSPNNILNMAMLKGLDLICIVDHNSTRQLQAFLPLLSSYDFSVIPGIEIESFERFHIVGYFETFDDAIAFGNEIEQYLDLSKRTDSMTQELFDEYDNIIDLYPVYLHQTLPLDYHGIIALIKKHHGLASLAHIDRYFDRFLTDYHNIIQDFDFLEVNLYASIEPLLDRLPILKQAKILRNSDAHFIERIAEQEYYLELTEKSFQGLKEWSEHHG